MDKHEWRKKEKYYYIPKAKPEVVDIENFKFIQIKGSGNPNSEEFSQKIGTLYSIAYAIKMMPKKDYTLDGYFEYTVYPLEGVWSLDEEGIEKMKNNIFDKDNLTYNLMIRQPEFVTKEFFDIALQRTKTKKDNKYLDDVVFGEIEDGMCIQMMHIGSYDDEPKTFKVMQEFCQENNLNIKSMNHREIYISDFRKTAKEKLKTVLRYRVEQK